MNCKIDELDIFDQQRRLFVLYNQLLQKFKDGEQVTHEEMGGFATDYTALEMCIQQVNSTCDSCDYLPVYGVLETLYQYQTDMPPDVDVNDEDLETRDIESLLNNMLTLYRHHPLNNIKYLVQRYNYLIVLLNTQNEDFSQRYDRYSDMLRYLNMECNKPYAERCLKCHVTLASENNGLNAARDVSQSVSYLSNPSYLSGLSESDLRRRSDLEVTWKDKKNPGARSHDELLGNNFVLHSPYQKIPNMNDFQPLQLPRSESESIIAAGGGVRWQQIEPKGASARPVPKQEKSYSFSLLVGICLGGLMASAILLLLASSSTSGLAIAGWTCLGASVLTAVGTRFFAGSKNTGVNLSVRQRGEIGQIAGI